ncbi:MAG: FecR domain-containing protein [Gemmatimonadota bacterium]|nr:FecR domain-containing protein [Gemmatimonadota bacterium]
MTIRPPDTTSPSPAQPLDEQPDWEALGRFLAGECSATEASTVSAWLTDHPDDAELVGVIDRAMESVRSSSGIDVEAALERVRARRDARMTRDELPSAPHLVLLDTRRPTRPLWRSNALRVAAALACVAIGALVWRSARGTSDEPARTMATAVGKRLEMRLPDSSRVVLGPDSRLTVHAGYNNGRREVELSGEAWFDVQHDAAHPFTVRAGDAEIRDVGTTFVVHSDTNDVRVAVTSGIVRVRLAAIADDTGSLLRAGDRWVSLRGQLATAERAGVASHDTAWMHGQLSFRDAPLAEVRAELRRWYGIELQVRDSSLDRFRLTADYTDEPIDLVLRALALASRTSIERNGNIAILHPLPDGARRR